MNWISDFVVRNPIALLGLLSLIIPILIHLFNPSRGKTILIGNIQLIAKAKNLRVTEVKIKQWLLLVTRLLILLILTLIVIDLVQIKDKSPANSRHAFVTPNWLEQATTKEKRDLVSQSDTDKYYLMHPDFPLIDDLTSYQIPSHTEFKIDTLLSKLLSTELVAERNLIYATTDLSQFSKNRNSVLLNGLSTANFEWILKPLKNDTQARRLISVFYADNRQPDLDYLRLAMVTMEKFSSGINVSYNPLGSLNNVDEFLNDKIERPDWIFWLSDSAIPERISEAVAQGSFLFKDSDNLVSNGRLISVPVEEFNINFKHSLPNRTDLEAFIVWSNMKGDSALSYQIKGKGKYFQFYSRFSSDWNNLASNIQLPVILSKLISQHNQKDRQIVSDSELPKTSISTLENTFFSMSLESYRSLLLLLLTLLWLVERYLSESRRHNDD